MAEKIRRPRAEVQKFVDLLNQEMPDVVWAIGGSWRRGAPTIGDLDVMITTSSGQFEDFRFPQSFTIIRRGPQIANGIIVIDGDPVDAMGADFWTCKPEQVGAFLCFITGPKALNIAQRAQAQKRGMKLSQYGLFTSNGSLVETYTEQDVYRCLGIPWLEPEERQRWAEAQPVADNSSVPQITTWAVRSSRTEEVYTVTRKRWRNGETWTCTCKSYIYSRQALSTCKHIDDKKANLTGSK